MHKQQLQGPSPREHGLPVFVAAAVQDAAHDVVQHGGEAQEEGGLL